MVSCLIPYKTRTHSGIPLMMLLNTAATSLLEEGERALYALRISDINPGSTLDDWRAIRMRNRTSICRRRESTNSLFGVATAYDEIAK